MYAQILRRWSPIITILMYLWLPILTLLVCWGQGVSAMHLGPFEHVPLRPQHPDAATVQLQNGSALLHAFNATTSTTKSTVTDLVYQIPQQIDATTSLDAKKNPLKKGRRGRIFLSYNYNNNHNESSSSQKYAESHLQQLWQDRMREKRARILVHRHQLLSHLNVSNGTNLKPSSNLINPSVSLNATNHHESPPSADIVELLESIAAANRKRRESRIHTPLSLRPRQRRYCSARDPSTLAFEAPTVFEGKIKSMSSDRRTNFSVTFEITKIHKQQAAYKLPQNVRLQFSYRNFSECDIYREEFRQRGFVRDELEQGKLYFLFVKQINLGNNITILGQPIKKTKRAVNDVLLGVSDNYGKRASIDLLTSNLTVREGKRVRLVCKVSGQPAPKVTWFKDGRSINRNRLKYGFVHLRRRSELIIRSAVRNDTGRYECRAKNKLASKPVSNFTRIEVLPKDYVPTKQPIGWRYSGSNCPHEAGELFCLNGGKCVFFIPVGEPACTCPDGFMGNRCETKNPTNFQPNPEFTDLPPLMDLSDESDDDDSQ